MTDRRFYGVVIESTSMMGPDGEYHTAICKTCSTQHKVTKDEFQMTDLYTLESTEGGFDTKPATALDINDNHKEILKYVAEMRSWQCCHEGADPIEGFPEPPDSNRIHFK